MTIKISELPSGSAAEGGTVPVVQGTETKRRSIGTAAYINAGTSTGDAAVLDASGKFPLSVLPLIPEAGLTQAVLDMLSALPGEEGKYPALQVVSDGERRVLQVSYHDADGTAAATPAGGFVASTGLVATVALAQDIRGAVGPGGDPGPAGAAGQSELYFIAQLSPAGPVSNTTSVRNSEPVDLPSRLATARQDFDFAGATLIYTLPSGAGITGTGPYDAYATVQYRSAEDQPWISLPNHVRVSGTSSGDSLLSLFTAVNALPLVARQVRLRYSSAFTTTDTADVDFGGGEVRVYIDINNQVHTGSVEPDDGDDGQDGDLYVRTSNPHELYHKAGGSWSQIQLGDPNAGGIHQEAAIPADTIVDTPVSEQTHLSQLVTLDAELRSWDADFGQPLFASLTGSVHLAAGQTESARIEIQLDDSDANNIATFIPSLEVPSETPIPLSLAAKIPAGTTQLKVRYTHLSGTGRVQVNASSLRIHPLGRGVGDSADYLSDPADAGEADVPASRRLLKLAHEAGKNIIFAWRGSEGAPTFAANTGASYSSANGRIETPDVSANNFRLDLPRINGVRKVITFAYEVTSFNLNFRFMLGESDGSLNKQLLFTVAHNDAMQGLYSIVWNGGSNILRNEEGSLQASFAGVGINQKNILRYEVSANRIRIYINGSYVSSFIVPPDLTDVLIESIVATPDGLSNSTESLYIYDIAIEDSDGEADAPEQGLRKVQDIGFLNTSNNLEVTYEKGRTELVPLASAAAQGEGVGMASAITVDTATHEIRDNNGFVISPAAKLDLVVAAPFDLAERVEWDNAAKTFEAKIPQRLQIRLHGTARGTNTGASLNEHSSGVAGPAGTVAINARLLAVKTVSGSLDTPEVFNHLIVGESTPTAIASVDFDLNTTISLEAGEKIQFIVEGSGNSPLAADGVPYDHGVSFQATLLELHSFDEAEYGAFERARSLRLLDSPFLMPSGGDEFYVDFSQPFTLSERPLLHLTFGVDSAKQPLLIDLRQVPTVDAGTVRTAAHFGSASSQPQGTLMLMNGLYGFGAVIGYDQGLTGAYQSVHGIRLISDFGNPDAIIGMAARRLKGGAARTVYSAYALK